MIIPITHANDPRINAFKNIRERDLLRENGLFIAEGKSVLNVLAQQTRFEIVSLFILENRLNGLSEVIKQLHIDIPIYIASRSIIDEIAGFPMHRGVLALASQPKNISSLPSHETSHNWTRIVALSHIANHDNIGAIFRNAAAFNADAVLLDKQSCNPLYRKAIRVSVGGIFKVPYYIFPDTETILFWLKNKEFEIAALSPSGSQKLHKWTPKKRTAILLGAEGQGLNNKILSSHKTIQIDMREDFDSLNVATATGIALHHLFSMQN